MILLLDTSTPTCHLTLVEGEAIYDYSWEANRQLADGLLDFISQKLTKHGKVIKDIEAIAVMKGPGSFTGLRIGLIVANTLADSLAIPIVGSGGDDWQAKAMARLKNHQSDGTVMPHYGAEANITKPRK